MTTINTSPVLCHDCGSAPSWKYAAPLSYCKGCYRKGGNSTSCIVDRDALDLLLRRVGVRVADECLQLGPMRTLTTEQIVLIATRELTLLQSEMDLERGPEETWL